MTLELAKASLLQSTSFIAKPFESMKRPVFFFHLHKCAGTYVRKAFGDSGHKFPSFLVQLEKNGRTPKHPVVRHKNGNIFYISENGNTPDIKWRGTHPEKQYYYLDYFLRVQRCNYVSSEWDFPSPEIIRSVSPKIFIFTAIRTPLSRALSNWRFDNQNPRLIGTIGTFELWKSLKEAQTLDNFYVRSLAGVYKHEVVTESHYLKAESVLKMLDSVVVLERQDLTSLLARAGVGKNTKIANVSKDKEKYIINDEQIYKFEEENGYDLRLYNFCKTLPLASIPAMRTRKVLSKS